MRLIVFSVFIGLLTLLSCQEDVPDPYFIVNQSIITHGGEVFENSVIEFDFRSTKYYRKRDKGTFLYRKEFTNEEGEVIIDSLDNLDFKRFQNGNLLNLSDERKEKLSASINSVIYFGLLPFRLNDESVLKRYLGKTEIAEKNYYKIEVTFIEAGGGKDYQDIFVYWIEEQSFSMDYFAYSYSDNSGIGYRFRSFYNRRNVNGIIIQDYENYKFESDTIIHPGDLDKVFIDGNLDLLSNIELKDVSVLTLTQ